MLSRSIFRLTRNNLRLFSTILTTATVQQGQPKSVLKDDRLASISKDFHVVDLNAVPTYTLGQYQDQCESIFLNFMNSIKKIPSGRATSTYLESLPVYSFLEHVELTTAARVHTLGDNKFKVVAFDVANAPLIEVALKSTPYKIETLRNHDEIDVTVTLDKESVLETVKGVVETYKKQLDSVIGVALHRLKGRDSKVEGSLGHLKDLYIAKIDKVLTEKNALLK